MVLKRKKQRKIIGKNALYGIGIIVCVVLLAAVVVLRFGDGNGGNTGSKEPGSYGFEVGTQGWIFRVFADSMAITSVVQNTENSLEGSASLQCTVDLIGGDTQKGKGELFVDLMSHPPLGIIGPVDLSDKTFSVWVYLPAEASGDPTKPNGIQLFFKDTDFNSKYSSWQNIGTMVHIDQWEQVTVDIATESWAWDDGCNLSLIGELGIKIATGGGSTENFSGTMLVDNVAWY